MKPAEKGKIRKISEERVALLLSEAEKVFPKDNARAKRYVKLAFAIVKKNKCKLTIAQKLAFCRGCFAFWRPGASVKIYLDCRNRMLVYECRECGKRRKLKYK